MMLASGTEGARFIGHCHVFVFGFSKGLLMCKQEKPEIVTLCLKCGSRKNSPNFILLKNEVHWWEVFLTVGFAFFASLNIQK